MAGKLFVEASFKPTSTFRGLENQILIDLTKPDLNFELLEDILKSDTASKRLGSSYDEALAELESLKVVEYVGPKITETCYSSNNVKIEIQAFKLSNAPRSFEDSSYIPEGEITPMPHVRFQGIWDGLMFESNVKEELIWMMANILRLSQQSNNEPGDLSPLILLYGPPGTGKTSLCQGLAQKIAIRLKHTYTRTNMVQIKTATLLSKYFSESAKQVDEIFTKLARMCEDKRDEFICVVIDEVESIAVSRETSFENGESHDSVRAMNAFLTGLDRIQSYSNIIFLCTSNMSGALDDAFLDRCGLKQRIEPPSAGCQYEILRKKIQRQIDQGIIQSKEILPTFEEMKVGQYLEEHSSGNTLLGIVKLIREVNMHASSGKQYTGRGLAQLPEQAILRYLREHECDLEMALGYILRLIRSDREYVPSLNVQECTEGKESTGDEENTQSTERKEVSYLQTELIRPKKRKITVTIDDDDGILKEIVGMLKRRAVFAEYEFLRKDDR